MSTASHFSLHDVERVETHLKCMNGRWNRYIKIIAGTHEMDIVLHGRDGLAPTLTENGAEYVHVEDSPCRVERSDKPFSDSPSSDGSK